MRRRVLLAVKGCCCGSTTRRARRRIDIWIIAGEFGDGNTKPALYVKATISVVCVDYAVSDVELR
jgi:hypothetical protein